MKHESQLAKMELRQRAPPEGEVKGETDADDGTPREQRQDLMRWIDHLHDGVTHTPNFRP